MGVKKGTFATARALAVIDQIAAYMDENESASLVELAKLTGKHTNTIGAYLSHMNKEGIVHCCAPSTSYQGGTTQARWALGKGSGAITNGLTGVRRNVIVRKQWEPNHKRSAMDCLLFGTPAAMAA